MTMALGAGTNVGHNDHGGLMSALVHALRDTAASLPLVLAATVLSLEAFALVRRRLALSDAVLEPLLMAQFVALSTSAVLAPGAVLHGRLLDDHAVSLSHGLADAAGVMPIAFIAALAFVSATCMPTDVGPGGWLAEWLRPVSRVVATVRGVFGHRRRVTLRSVLAVALVATSIVSVTSLASDLVEPASAEQPSQQTPCSESIVNREYAMTAINVVIPRNRWGDVDQHGQIFALDQDKDALKYWAFPLGDPAAAGAGDRRLRPRPLVLRANAGECVSVTLANELDVPAPVPAGSPPAYGSVLLPGEGLPTGQWVSLHVNGVSYNVQTSGGGQVGFNAETGVAPGGSNTYYLRVPDDEGIYFLRDGETLAGSEADGGSVGHGLYGAFAVEPPGSAWYDPVSGAELSTGRVPYTEVASQSGELYLDAIIKPLGGAAFRESIQISQDEMPGVHLQNCDLAAADNADLVDGRPNRSSCASVHTTTPNSLEFGIGLGFNYAEEHLLLRQHAVNRCPDCVGEETWLSSWPYGDPGLVKLASGFGPWYPQWHPWYDGGADGVGANNGQQNFDNEDDPEDCGIASGCYTANVPQSYQYDSTKIRFVHAGPVETHVFHMHAHQWLTDPQDLGTATPTNISETSQPEATTIDSQTYGPGEAFTAELLFGAGSKPGTVGDSIFHCHLYPHFAEGFWSLFRVHDVYENGDNRTPDGIKVRAVQALPDDLQPPDPPDALNPGFPNFIPGEFGWRAPQPIDGIYEPNGVPDDPATVEREDLQPATRLVAGVGLVQPVQEIWAEAVAEPVGDPEFELGLDGELTAAPLAVGATAAQVEAALEGLSGIAKVTVTGDGSVSSPYEVQFVRLNNGAPASTIQLDVVPNADATGGSSASWDDDGPREAAATELAYKLSLEHIKVLTSHNDGIFDSGNGSWNPLSSVDPANTNKPGAPLVDPCLLGSREITYNVSMVQLDITYNDNGWHDTQGRLVVLNEDLPAILAGTKPIEPFFFRANPGDCVNLNMTNLMPNWFGHDDFLEMIQTNMAGQHIHLVKFDVTGSDGSSNGWNYQQAAFSEAQRLWDDAVLSGPANTLPNHPELSHIAGTEATCGPDLFEGADLQPGGCRIVMPPNWNPQWSCQAAGGCPVGQTISERWFVDYDLRTIFTHDHHFPAEDQNRGLFAALVVEPSGMDVRDPVSGQYLQPINDPAHGPVCGTACNANSVGTRLDVIGPAADDDFREFSLAIQDFVSLYRPCTACGSSVIPGEEPLAAPAEPELYPNEDPGVMGINYRNAPFLIRDSVGGVATDPAYVFSSTVHGDPDTPLLQAYVGDPVRARVIQGAQEEQHVVQIHGMSWLQEPDDPESPIVNAMSVGISEAFNFEIPSLSCGVGEDCVGDYLYSGASTDDMWAGAWGLMRVYGKGVNGLLPLPDNVPQAAGGTTNFNVTGSPPPAANTPGSPCPVGAPTRSYEVIAVDAPIVYNGDGDHDPYGLVYSVVQAGETPEQTALRVRSSNPEPMVLRAHEGDCIEVQLTNMIDPAGAFATLHAPHGANQTGNGFDPPLVLEAPNGTPAGLRVSLHADLVTADVRGSNGATVGFNRDQTVGPGESIDYSWYAHDVTPGELGAINLTDYGDVRGHRHHGLFAGLVIEPRGSTWADPVTGELGTTSAQADIRVRDQSLDGNDSQAADFREFVTFYQDGLNLWDAAGVNIPDQLDGGVFPDAEDRGEKALNYRNESFHHRLDQPAGVPHDNLDGVDLAHVFSSTVHEDPDTPILRAYAGDDIRWRVLQGADKPRQHTFAIDGHSWLRQPNETDAESETIGAQGGVSVGRALNIHTTAGGTTQSTGDFLYGDQVLGHKLSGGWWGILRVYDPANAAVPPDAFSAQDDPHQAEYGPILPLGSNTISVEVFADHDGDGLVENGDDLFTDLAAGLELAVHVQGNPTRLYAVAVEPDGTTPVSVSPGLYDIYLGPALGTLDWDYAVTNLNPISVDATSQATPQGASFAVTQLGDITVDLLYDPTGSAFGLADAVRGAGGWAGFGEDPAGWLVQLVSGEATLEALTDVEGAVTFDGLLPGDYEIVVPVQAGWALNEIPGSISLAENDTVSADVGVHRVAGVSLHLFNDADQLGTQSYGERDLDGWTVTATLQGSASLPSLVTNAAGAVTFPDVDAGIYDISVAPPKGPAADWSVTNFSVEVTDLPSLPLVAAQSDCLARTCTTLAISNETTTVELGLHNPNLWVSLSLFGDLDNDGARDAKERKLVGFPVTISGPGLTSPQTMPVGNDGMVEFYVPAEDGPFALMVSEPPGADLLWYLAPFASGDDPLVALADGGTPQLSVPPTLAGDTISLDVGAIQPGTVVAQAFHDRDGDGDWEADEEPLGGRLVRLLPAKGNTKTALDAKFTGPTGTATFQVAASAEFRLEVLSPSGWVETYPYAANGAPTSIASIVSSDNPSASETALFGQREAVDATPPSKPIADPGGATYLEDSLVVGLSAEAGADIRYRLDGVAPTSTTGISYTGPLTLGTGAWELRAIAIDAAGLVSDLLVESYDIIGGGVSETIDVGLISVAIVDASAASGNVTSLSDVDDGDELILVSKRRGQNEIIGFTGSANTTERAIIDMEVHYTSTQTLSGVTHRLFLWNHQSGSWEELWLTSSPTSGTEVITVTGDPNRFVSAGGDVGISVTTRKRRADHTLEVDGLWLVLTS
jgi:Fn3 associated